VYSLAGYGEMIADRVRIQAYSEALRRVIRPGSTVVDIGTGPGIMAVLACQLGAGRVFAIEPDEIIQVAREVAAANRCADKIVFYENLSTQVTLPGRADVMVSDMRGILPLFEQHIPAIVDARQRFLAPGGAMVPQRDRMWAAVVEDREGYGGLVEIWEHNVLNHDLSPARRRAANTFRKVRATPEQLLTKPKVWTTLDYAVIEKPDARGNLNWTVERAGTGHGVLVWFEAELAEGVHFSNAPGAPEAIYGSLFFPWTQPVSLAPGQEVCVSLEAKLLEDDYAWRWTSCILPADGSGDSPVHFEQSQLQGAVLSMAKLHKQASDYVPHLSDEGLIHRRALEMMQGQASLEEIARQLAAEFPRRFATWHQAMSYAGNISRRYSE